MKRTIIPHIRSCKIVKDAWDTLTTLYQASNEARIAYLRKQLESEHMNEGDSMDSFLTKIKHEPDEIIPNSSLVQTFLNGRLDSYQSFASTLRLMMKGNDLSSEELVFVLLQEDQSRPNRSIVRVVDQCFQARQKGKGKYNSFASKQRFANTSQVNEKKTRAETKTVLQIL